MEKGLPQQEAVEKLRVVGKNEIIVKQAISPLKLFLSQFATFLNAILFAAAVFSLIIADVLDGVLIFAIILLNAVIGFIQEYRAEKALEKLKNYIKPTVRVIRDSQTIEIPTTDIVPGDVVVLSAGDRIPADGKLHTHAGMHIDESILTGESMPAEKVHMDLLFSGTLVAQGEGHLLVEKTGMQTKFGNIAATLSTITMDRTPLQKSLDRLAKILSLGVIVIAMLIVPIGITQGQTLFPLILLAVSITVAAIPQSLPAVVTIALAIGTSRMAKHAAIVRKMPVVETLGAVQVILIDKTGTLTQNAMRVKKHWTTSKESLAPMLQACVLGNTASLVRKADGPTEQWDIVGDKTDGALLLWASLQIPDIEEIKKQNAVLEEFPFDPETKTISTVVKIHDTHHIFTRGAPEAVLARSNLSDTEKKHIQALFEMHAKEGLRVIGFGTKTDHHDKLISRMQAEDNLTFLGFVGIYDPPRVEAKHAVLEARRAGIHTVMVTGDNELTAMTIAKEVGLIEENEDVISSDELAKLSDEELFLMLPKTRIFARSTPEDKLRLVETYKQMGYVVGVTGDGVNDAMALKRADVGISMGGTGTDVAKEASDIVLTDDNFASLVKAVEEGRTIYNNIVKAVTYLLSGNLSEISLILFAVMLGMPSPLLPTQILWINLITDGLPALALASDNKDPNILHHKPRDPKMPLLTPKRIAFITVVGFSLTAFLLYLFSFFLETHSEAFARTVVFNVLIFSHMLIAFLVRGTFRVNKFLLISVMLILCMQYVITTTPFFQNIFHLEF